MPDQSGPAEPRRPRGRATLADVAAAAGVSPSTASLAFSGAGPVAAATRERVLAAAPRLGYAGPDPTRGLAAARPLGRGRRRGRRAAAGRLPRPLRGDDAGRSGRRPRRAGAGHPAPADDPRRERRAGRAVPRGGPWTPWSSPRAASSTTRRWPWPAAAGVPVVAVEGPDVPEASVVRIDDRAGTAGAVRHLVDLGHRDVAVVTMPWQLDGTEGLLEPARRPRQGSATTSTGWPACWTCFGRSAVWECLVQRAWSQGGPPRRALLDAPGVVAADRGRGPERRAGRRGGAGLRGPGPAGPGGRQRGGLRRGRAAVAGPARADHARSSPCEAKARATGEAVLARLAGGGRTDTTLPVRLRVGTTTGPLGPAERQARARVARVLVSTVAPSQVTVRSTTTVRVPGSVDRTVPPISTRDGPGVRHDDRPGEAGRVGHHGGRVPRPRRQQPRGRTHGQHPVDDDARQPDLAGHAVAVVDGVEVPARRGVARPGPPGRR